MSSLVDEQLQVGDDEADCDGANRHRGHSCNTDQREGCDKRRIARGNIAPHLAIVGFQCVAECRIAAAGLGVDPGPQPLQVLGVGGRGFKAAVKHAPGVGGSW